MKNKLMLFYSKPNMKFNYIQFSTSLMKNIGRTHTFYEKNIFTPINKENIIQDIIFYYFLFKIYNIVCNNTIIHYYYVNNANRIIRKLLQFLFY